MASPYGSVSPEGGLYGFTLFLTLHRDGVDSAYLPEERHLRWENLELPYLSSYLLVKPVSIVGLCWNDDIYQQFTYVSHTARA